MSFRPEPAPGLRPVPSAEPGSAELLQVAVREPRPGVLVVAPVGEIDLSTASLLCDCGVLALDAAPAQLVVDLAGVDFCGSTGLVVLVELQRLAADAGVPFNAVGGSRLVRRVLTIIGMGPLLGHRETLAEVLDDPAGS